MSLRSFFFLQLRNLELFVTKPYKLSRDLKKNISKMDYSTDCPSYEEIHGMAKELMKYTSLSPKLGIICGSGLSGLTKLVDKPTTVEYSSIPGFPVSTVKGHHGKFVFGSICGKPVLLMQGRFHYYEGYPMWKVTLPVRVMKAVGIETLIVTNAAGGLNQQYNRGDIMVIKDHIDLPGLTGGSVLRGKNDERFGPRFVATNGTYTKELRELFLETAANMGHSGIVREGVYVMVGGPTYSSLAESKILLMFGADAVGMSTIPESIVAKHCGMRVLGISLITDMVGMDDKTQIEITHEEVLQTANERAELIQKLVFQFIELMD